MTSPASTCAQHLCELREVRLPCVYHAPTMRPCVGLPIVVCSTKLCMVRENVNPIGPIFGWTDAPSLRHMQRWCVVRQLTQPTLSPLTFLTPFLHQLLTAYNHGVLISQCPFKNVIFQKSGGKFPS